MTMYAAILALALAAPSTDPWEGRYEGGEPKISYAAFRLTVDGAKYKATGFWGWEKLVGKYDPTGNQFAGKLVFRQGGTCPVTGYWSNKSRRFVLTSDSGDALFTMELGKVDRR